MSRRAHTALTNCVLALVAGASVLSACGDRAASDGSPYGEIVARVVPQLEEQLGLPFKTPPRIETRSRDEVKKFVMAQLSSERGRTQIGAQQSIYRILGLIPDTMDLGGLLQRLLEEQIIGYYDPATKVLYVVDGAPKAMLEQTVAHELVHALQDQYVAIDSIQKMTDDADRQSAAQSILEGQAVFQQLRIDPNIGPMLKMPGGWDRIRDAMRDEQTGMPVFSSAPRAVREGLLFPYLGGADFVRRYIEKRPEKELLTDLPVSSRQILNDAAYFTADKSARNVPVAVTLPAPPSGTVIYSNNFGEFETRLILVQHIRDEPLARRAASGIDGDRYSLIRTPTGEALVWVSVWDSSVDAADFLDVFGDAMRRRYEIGRQDIPAGTTSRTLDAPAKGQRGARRVSLELRQLDGRDVVIFVDAPAAAGTKLIDPARITFGK
ncbi:MAG TPA: hypothetical protein VE869_00265 [Gemmatimonas sp.]|nr:hypothetical protein [Gemmatimonas sp.]